MAGEYVLISRRGIPLREQGVYGFQICLSGQTPALLEIPVLTVGSAVDADVH
jgi:hypothetical protein